MTEKQITQQGVMKIQKVCFIVIAVVSLVFAVVILLEFLNGIVPWQDIGVFCFFMVVFLNQLFFLFIQKKNNNLIEQDMNKKRNIKRILKILLIVIAFFLLAAVAVLLFGIMDSFDFWVLVVMCCSGMIMFGANIGQYISLKKKIYK